jgi:hypothetical protein
VIVKRFLTVYLLERQELDTSSVKNDSDTSYADVRQN